MSNRKAILINGVPASGKTAIGKIISNHYHDPLLSLDVIKEAIFDVMGVGDRDYSRLLTRTSKKIIWSIIKNFPEETLIFVDAWFGKPPHNELLIEIENANITVLAEIWCYASSEVLRERYVTRVDHRHRGHPGREYGNELFELSKVVSPTNICPVYCVDTTDFSKINYQRMILWIDNELNLKT